MNWETIVDVTAKVATVTGAVGIWVAYCQYRHSVKLARSNNHRASVELAARECAHYGTVFMKQLDELHAKLKESGSAYLEHCKTIKEDNQLKFDATAVTQEDLDKIKPFVNEVLRVLNLLEGFAIPFAAGVADDNVGFMECGQSFVSIFESCFPLYRFKNLDHYYQSTQRVYWRWKKRIAQEELERKHSQVSKEFFVLSEQLVRGKSNSGFGLALAALFRSAAEKLDRPRT